MSSNLLLSRVMGAVRVMTIALEMAAEVPYLTNKGAELSRQLNFSLKTLIKYENPAKPIAYRKRLISEPRK